MRISLNFFQRVYSKSPNTGGVSPTWRIVPLSEWLVKGVNLPPFN